MTHLTELTIGVLAQKGSLITSTLTLLEKIKDDSYEHHTVLNQSSKNRFGIESTKYRLLNRNRFGEIARLVDFRAT